MGVFKKKFFKKVFLNQDNVWVGGENVTFISLTCLILIKHRGIVKLSVHRVNGLPNMDYLRVFIGARSSVRPHM